jgi:hypothetical protein
VPVAKGTFSAILDTSGSLPYELTGEQTADDVTYDVFGTPVNAGTAPGLNPVAGSGQLTSVSGNSGTYTVHLESSTAGVLAADEAGSFVCASSGCLSGAPGGSFVATVTAASGSLAASLPPAVYTQDGYITEVIDDFAPLYAFSGVFAINAFLPVSTPTGTEVTTDLTDTTYFDSRTGLVVPIEATVTFDSVSSGGTTTLTATTAAAGTIPAEFAIDIGGFKALFLDISTAATHGGMTTVCLHYLDEAPADGVVDGTLVTEQSLRFLHEEGGTFVDRTLQPVDFVNNNICAEVSSLSPFAVAVSSAALPVTSWPGLLVLAALTLGAGVFPHRRRATHAPSATR